MNLRIDNNLELTF